MAPRRTHPKLDHGPPLQLGTTCSLHVLHFRTDHDDASCAIGSFARRVVQSRPVTRALQLSVHIRPNRCARFPRALAACVAAPPQRSSATPAAAGKSESFSSVQLPRVRQPHDREVPALHPKSNDIPSRAAITGTGAQPNAVTLASMASSVRLGSWWNSTTFLAPARSPSATAYSIAE